MKKNKQIWQKLFQIGAVVKILSVTQSHLPFLFKIGEVRCLQSGPCAFEDILRPILHDDSGRCQPADFGQDYNIRPAALAEEANGDSKHRFCFLSDVYHTNFAGRKQS